MPERFRAGGGHADHGHALPFQQGPGHLEQGLVVINYDARQPHELRDLARGVHPAILTEAGLGEALRALARRSPLPVRLHIHAAGRLPAESEATAYYVVSEAFANAVKHASASGVDVEVKVAEGTLSVRVSDDGVGGADASRGSGLTGIRDRVEAVGGLLAVQSPPGSGTALTARLPLAEPAD